MRSNKTLKVVFLGAPSTGKTTLCQLLASQHNTVWMPEYGLEYWLQHQSNRRLTQQQLLEIARGHRQQEEQLNNKAKDYLFVDTEAITTRLFALDYHGESNPELDHLADQSKHRYDMFFLCQDDIPYDDTWYRSGDMNRTRFQKMIIEELERRQISYLSLEGSLEQRLSIVNQSLQTQPTKLRR